ncbi:MAG: hypothetical protein L0Y72_17045 [Gemmataceae bacterium]|nr:hypothetical protein [Gemmataceae bacterium]MCI0740759.1 hypothetical protein [Gemmataceae bacterium]
MFKNLTSTTPYLKPFPAFDDVFAEPMDLHRKHFLPLISVDASVVHRDLDFWLHFVTPIEPLLELDVGYFTKEHHDFYNIEGQFAFRFSEGKYAFAGYFNYFAYESGAIFGAFPNQEEEIRADYRTRVSSYEESRRGFLRHGRIPSCAESPYDPARDSCGPLISQLGGEPVLANWQQVVPVNRSGKPFRYIGEVQGFSYCAGGIQAILLFYDPEEQIALFRSEWT